ncbi:Phosphate transport system protein phoU [Granulibacter bethesdensis]|nr:Phosphate transport system protein phoU [Granulibacter bethesdensis]
MSSARRNTSPVASADPAGIDAMTNQLGSPHIVSSYEQDLQQLSDMITRMGGMVENQLALAVTSIINKDMEAANRAIDIDPAIDALETEIQQFIVRLLALRQPVAIDLRMVLSALKITSDLERIGDYSKNVAKRGIVLNQFSLPFSLTGLAHMGQLVQQNMKTIIDAVGENDTSRAEEVWRSDTAIDDMYNAIFRELITYMMEDPRDITPCTHLLFIAKNLERIGDHATNIAETVFYTVSGHALPDERPKSDNTSYMVARPSPDATS